jgi:hypothetical protein
MTIDDLPIVHVERDGITIGGVRLPDYIENSVTIRPGFGTDTNRVSVTFIVGHIRVDDPTIDRSADDDDTAGT